MRFIVHASLTEFLMYLAILVAILVGLFFLLRGRIRTWWASLDRDYNGKVTLKEIFRSFKKKK